MVYIDIWYMLIYKKYINRSLYILVLCIIFILVIYKYVSIKNISISIYKYINLEICIDI